MAPVTMQNSIPNEDQLKRCYGGTEALLGVSVPPTFRLYGDVNLDLARPLVDREEYDGTRFKDHTPVWGPTNVSGTYKQALTYEDGPILGRYAMVGGGTGVTDGNATPGYIYVQEPSPDRFDIDFMSGEHGFPGLPFKSTGVHFPEWTISAAIDDAEAAWMWNSTVLGLTKEMIAQVTGVATGGSTSTVVKTAAGWTIDAFAGAYVRMATGTAGNIDKIREILSNTATTLTIRGTFPAAVANLDTFEISGSFTAGVPGRTRETVSAPSTIITMDAVGAIGTTPLTGRAIGFSNTFSNNSIGKRFFGDTLGPSRYGFGAFTATGQIRVEFDRRREYDNWRNGIGTAIRIKNEGSVIDSGAGTHKLAQIDVYAAYWDVFTPDTRDTNITATFSYRGYVDVTEGIPGGMTWKNKLSVLP